MVIFVYVRISHRQKSRGYMYGKEKIAILLFHVPVPISTSLQYRRHPLSMERSASMVLFDDRNVRNIVSLV